MLSAPEVLRPYIIPAVPESLRVHIIEGENGMTVRSLIFTAAAFILIAASVPVGAATLHVPSEYPDIQAAVNAAGEGDIVMVAGGTYTGASNREIEFTGANIVVTSVPGPELTIIDCEGAGRAFAIYKGEDSTSVIRGFTIINGSSGNGGGLYISGASPVIENCVISNCTASMNGGGVYYGYASAQGYIRYCAFYGDSSQYRGGGIMLDQGYGDFMPVEISNCVFYDNAANAGGDYGGGAVYANSCPSLITSCTIVGNSGGDGAGGIHAYGSNVTARNTIIAFNAGAYGTLGVIFERCVLFENEGDTPGPSPVLLFADPLFCDRASRDLNLCSNSPCVPTAADNPWGELIGAFGVGCMDCETATRESSWGSIKSGLRR